MNEVYTLFIKYTCFMLVWIFIIFKLPFISKIISWLILINYLVTSWGCIITIYNGYDNFQDYINDTLKEGK